MLYFKKRKERQHNSSRNYGKQRNSYQAEGHSESEDFSNFQSDLSEEHHGKHQKDLGKKMKGAHNLLSQSDDNVDDIMETTEADFYKNRKTFANQRDSSRIQKKKTLHKLKASRMAKSQSKKIDTLDLKNKDNHDYSLSNSSQDDKLKTNRKKRLSRFKSRSSLVLSDSESDTASSSSSSSSSSSASSSSFTTSNPSSKYTKTKLKSKKPYKSKKKLSKKKSLSKMPLKLRLKLMSNSSHSPTESPSSSDSDSRSNSILDQSTGDDDTNDSKLNSSFSQLDDSSNSDNINDVMVKEGFLSNEEVTDEERPHKDDPNGKLPPPSYDRSLAFYKHFKDYFLNLLPNKSHFEKLIKNANDKIIEKVPQKQPKGMKGKLRPHQIEALSFLAWLRQNSANGILSDQMGLGKTIEAISFICWVFDNEIVKNPFIVVAPLSVLNNWVDEFTKFAPFLKIVKFYGKMEYRSEIKDNLLKSNVIITTYETIILEKSFFVRKRFAGLILDEGHRIKNHNTQAAIALSRIKATTKLVMSGTPIQNNLSELWAILHFLYSDVFIDSSLEQFKSSFDLSKGIFDLDFIKHASNLLDIVSIRRLLSDVAKEIPEMEEYNVKLPLTPLQKELYEKLINKLSPTAMKLILQKLREAASSSNSSNLDKTNDFESSDRLSYSVNKSIRNTLLQLRKTCDHPFMFEGIENDFEKTTAAILEAVSVKFLFVRKLLEECNKTNKKVLIFSSYTRLLDILEDFIKLLGFKFSRLDGSVSLERRTLDIFLFKEKDRSIFLLSTRAGGLGINLANASVAVMFDYDFNPTIMQQAIGRCYRIGQSKKVVVYNLICRGSVEEKIASVLQQKLFLSNAVMDRPQEDLSDDPSTVFSILSSGTTAIIGEPANVDEMRGMSFDRMLLKFAKQTNQGQLDKNDLKDSSPIDKDVTRKIEEKINSRNQESKTVNSEVDRLQSSFNSNTQFISSKSKKVFWKTIMTNEKFCISCYESSRELNFCSRCPRSLHESCSNRSFGKFSRQSKQKRYICPQHHCHSCLTERLELDLRCQSCPNTFCFDCVEKQQTEFIGYTIEEMIDRGLEFHSKIFWIRCKDCVMKFSNDSKLEEKLKKAIIRDMELSNEEYIKNATTEENKEKEKEKEKREEEEEEEKEKLLDESLSYSDVSIMSDSNTSDYSESDTENNNIKKSSVEKIKDFKIRYDSIIHSELDTLTSENTLLVNSNPSINSLNPKENIPSEDHTVKSWNTINTELPKVNHDTVNFKNDTANNILDNKTPASLNYVNRPETRSELVNDAELQNNVGTDVANKLNTSEILNTTANENKNSKIFHQTNISNNAIINMPTNSSGLPLQNNKMKENDNSSKSNQTVLDNNILSRITTELSESSFLKYTTYWVQREPEILFKFGLTSYRKALIEAIDELFYQIHLSREFHMTLHIFFESKRATFDSLMESAICFLRTIRMTSLVACILYKKPLLIPLNVCYCASIFLANFWSANGFQPQKINERGIKDLVSSAAAYLLSPILQLFYDNIHDPTINPNNAYYIDSKKLFENFDRAVKIDQSNNLGKNKGGISKHSTFSENSEQKKIDMYASIKNNGQFSHLQGGVSKSTNNQLNSVSDKNKNQTPTLKFQDTSFSSSNILTNQEKAINEPISADNLKKNHTNQLFVPTSSGSSLKSTNSHDSVSNKVLNTEVNLKKLRDTLAPYDKYNVVFYGTFKISHKFLYHVMKLLTDKFAIIGVITFIFIYQASILKSYPKGQSVGEQLEKSLSNNALIEYFLGAIKEESKLCIKNILFYQQALSNSNTEKKESIDSKKEQLSSVNRQSLFLEIMVTKLTNIYQHNLAQNSNADGPKSNANCVIPSEELPKDRPTSIDSISEFSTSANLVHNELPIDFNENNTIDNGLQNQSMTTIHNLNIQGKENSVTYDKDYLKNDNTERESCSVGNLKELTTDSGLLHTTEAGRKNSSKQKFESLNNLNSKSGPFTKTVADNKPMLQNDPSFYRISTPEIPNSSNSMVLKKDETDHNYQIKSNLSIVQCNQANNSKSQETSLQRYAINSEKSSLSTDGSNSNKEIKSKEVNDKLYDTTYKQGLLINDNQKGVFQKELSSIKNSNKNNTQVTIEKKSVTENNKSDIDLNSISKSAAGSFSGNSGLKNILFNSETTNLDDLRSQSLTKKANIFLSEFKQPKVITKRKSLSEEKTEVAKVTNEKKFIAECDKAPNTQSIISHSIENDGKELQDNPLLINNSKSNQSLVENNKCIAVEYNYNRKISENSELNYNKSDPATKNQEYRVDNQEKMATTGIQNQLYKSGKNDTINMNPNGAISTEQSSAISTESKVQQNVEKESLNLNVKVLEQSAEQNDKTYFNKVQNKEDSCLHNYSKSKVRLDDNGKNPDIQKSSDFATEKETLNIDNHKAVITSSKQDESIALGNLSYTMQEDKAFANNLKILLSEVSIRKNTFHEQKLNKSSKDDMIKDTFKELQSQPILNTKKNDVSSTTKSHLPDALNPETKLTKERKTSSVFSKNDLISNSEYLAHTNLISQESKSSQIEFKQDQNKSDKSNLNEIVIDEKGQEKNFTRKIDELIKDQYLSGGSNIDNSMKPQLSDNNGMKTLMNKEQLIGFKQNDKELAHSKDLRSQSDITGDKKTSIISSDRKNNQEKSINNKNILVMESIEVKNKIESDYSATNKESNNKVTAVQSSSIVSPSEIQKNYNKNLSQNGDINVLNSTNNKMEERGKKLQISENIIVKNKKKNHQPINLEFSNDKQQGFNSKKSNSLVSISSKGSSKESITTVDKNNNLLADAKEKENKKDQYKGNVMPVSEILNIENNVQNNIQPLHSISDNSDLTNGEQTFELGKTKLGSSSGSVRDEGKILNSLQIKKDYDTEKSKDQIDKIARKFEENDSLIIVNDKNNLNRLNKTDKNVSVENSIPFVIEEVPSELANKSPFVIEEASSGLADKSPFVIEEVSSGLADNSPLAIDKVSLELADKSPFIIEEFSSELADKSPFIIEEVTSELTDKSPFVIEEVSSGLADKSSFANEESAKLLKSITNADETLLENRNSNKPSSLLIKSLKEDKTENYEIHKQIQQSHKEARVSNNKRRKFDTNKEFSLSSVTCLVDAPFSIVSLDANRKDEDTNIETLFKNDTMNDKKLSPAYKKRKKDRSEDKNSPKKRRFIISVDEDDENDDEIRNSNENKVKEVEKAEEIEEVEETSANNTKDKNDKHYNKQTERHENIEKSKDNLDGNMGKKYRNAKAKANEKDQKEREVITLNDNDFSSEELGNMNDMIMQPEHKTIQLEKSSFIEESLLSNIKEERKTTNSTKPRLSTHKSLSSLKRLMQG